MTEPVLLAAEDAPQIAAFTRVACPYDLLTTTSVERSIFADPGPQTVVGAFGGGLEGVGAAVVRGERGWIKFLAVHPMARRRGIGSRLIEHLEAYCRDRGATSMQIGTSAPFYVVPGVDVRSMEAIALLNVAGYQHFGEAVNLSAPLRWLQQPPLAIKHADETDLERLRPWVDEHFPHWINELERGVSLGKCVVHNDLGFACWDVNREGWFGPIATKPDNGARGVGSATLLGALHELRAAGHERVEIAWAAAHDFYAKAVGARVSRVFWWYRKTL